MSITPICESSLPFNIDAGALSRDGRWVATLAGEPSGPRFLNLYTSPALPTTDPAAEPAEGPYDVLRTQFAPYTDAGDPEAQGTGDRRQEPERPCSLHLAA
jgi:hypothetical protein